MHLLPGLFELLCVLAQSQTARGNYWTHLTSVNLLNLFVWLASSGAVVLYVVCANMTLTPFVTSVINMEQLQFKGIEQLMWELLCWTELEVFLIKWPGSVNVKVLLSQSLTFTVRALWEVSRG